MWASDSPRASALIIEHELRARALSERIAAVQQRDVAAIAGARRIASSSSSHRAAAAASTTVSQREVNRLVNALKAADARAGPDGMQMLLGVEAFTVSALINPAGLPVSAVDAARACVIRRGYLYTGSTDRLASGKAHLLRRLRNGNEVSFFHSTLVIMQQILLMECAAYHVSPSVLFGLVKREAQAELSALQSSPADDGRVATARRAHDRAREARAAVELRLEEPAARLPSLRAALGWPPHVASLPAADSANALHPLFLSAEAAASRLQLATSGSVQPAPKAVVVPARWLAGTLEATVIRADTAPYEQILPQLRTVADFGESLQSYLARVLCFVGPRTVGQSEVAPAVPDGVSSAFGRSLFESDAVDDRLSFRPPFPKIARQLARVVLTRSVLERQQRASGTSVGAASALDSAPSGADAPPGTAAASDTVGVGAPAVQKFASDAATSGAGGKAASPSYAGGKGNLPEHATSPPASRHSGSSPSASAASGSEVIEAADSLPPSRNDGAANVRGSLGGQQLGGADSLPDGASASVVAQPPVPGEFFSRPMAADLTAAAGRAAPAEPDTGAPVASSAGAGSCWERVGATYAARGRAAVHERPTPCGSVGGGCGRQGGSARGCRSCVWCWASSPCWGRCCSG